MTDGAANQPSDHERELAAVRREFAQGLDARLAKLRDALDRLTRDPTRDAVQGFHMPAHALKGTAASFGADELVAPAAELAALGRRWLEAGAPPPDEVHAATAVLERLAAAIVQYRTRVGPA